jgi:hypothetical protein
MFAEMVYLGYEPDDVVQVLDAHIEQWRATSEEAALKKLEE